MAILNQPGFANMAGAPQALQMAYMRDPRLRLAQQLQLQGADSSPVQHWTQGAARLAQALAGGYVQDKADAEYAKQAGDYTANMREGLNKALAGDGAGANQIWAANPYSAPMVLQSQMTQAANAAKAKLDLANDLAKKGLRINDQTGQVEQIPGFGAASGDVEGAIAGGKERGQIGAQASMVPDLARIAGARAGGEEWGRNPALAERTRTNLQLDLQYRPQIAGATAAAENPALIARAGGTEEARLRAGLAPAPAAPGVPPGMTLGGAAAFGAEAGQQAAQAPSKIAQNETDLRKEFNTLPQAKNFIEVTPLYASALQTAQAKTKASDLNLVYAFGKMMDPGSVVREGEMVMVNNTSPFADILNRYASQLSGQSALTDATRNDLLRQMQSRYAEMRSQYGDAASQYQNIAQGRNLNPANILPSFNLPNDSFLSTGPGRGNNATVGGAAKAAKFLGFE